VGIKYKLIYEGAAMKNMESMLLNEKASSEIVIGNTALVRAMIESGVRVVTSYPGSPTPEIAAAIRSIKTENRPFYFEFSINEKVAAEVAFGASVNGHLSCVFFKSVGLNVAADSVIQFGLLNLIGGMVIILGDDPGANSSQNEQDNRHFAKMSYVPMLEPATPTEAYSMFKLASKWAAENQMPIFLRMTTHVCHAKERVQFEGYKPSPINEESLFDVKNGHYIPITSLVLPMKRMALSKLDIIRKASDAQTSIFNGNKSEFGIITAGLPYLSLMEVMSELPHKPDVLKLNVVYPLAEKAIMNFLKTHKKIKILEELDPILEEMIQALAYREKIRIKIIGKLTDEDLIGEYLPDKVSDVMHRTWPDVFPAPQKVINQQSISPRPAQLCPGCGHRAAFFAIRKAIDPSTISVGDIGCHTLGFLPPYEIGQVLLSMGHSNGTAAGIGIFNKKRKIISLLGDSTFFHAGLPGIVNAIFNHHKHTLIIMENGTTAMTGHQNHPGSGANFDEPADKIPIRKVLEGLGVKSIRECDTYQIDKLASLIREAVEENEFNVVIARHPCMLKFTRQQKRAGRKTPPPVQVTEKCDQSHVCISKFACPSYQINEDGSVWVQEDLCIGDGSCKPTCPQNAIESNRGEKNEVS
jgi:indolepyruvate ferredoxin oxidoreductase, alpha subunit